MDCIYSFHIPSWLCSNLPTPSDCGPRAPPTTKREVRAWGPIGQFAQQSNGYCADVMHRAGLPVYVQACMCELFFMKDLRHRLAQPSIVLPKAAFSEPTA